jgi:hypothetical protein
VILVLFARGLFMACRFYSLSNGRTNRLFPNRSFLYAVVLITIVSCALFSTGCGSSAPAATPSTAGSGSGKTTSTNTTTSTTTGGSTNTTTTSTSSGTTTSSQPQASLTVSNSLPSGTVGANYSATIAVTGGTAPYNFVATSGNIPQGLTLAASTGTISGTPSASGTASFTISVSDSTGISGQQSFQVAVSNAPAAQAPASQPSSGTTLSNIQHSAGWLSYGQQGPNYVDCSPSPCDGITYWMGQNISNPSTDGQASGFSVGGTSPFSDALFTNHLIGQGSTQNLPDNNQTLIPTLHDFTYDVYFYGGDWGQAQAIEFDINQFFDNLGLIFGHECRLLGGHQWDVWDNQNKKWVATGIPCYPNENSWNHLTIKVQRTSNNYLVYQSITLNGQTSTLNWSFPPGTSSGWYGVTTNYQMDGDIHQDSYTVYLDQMSLTYQ